MPDILSLISSWSSSYEISSIDMQHPFPIKAVLQKFTIFVLPLDNNGAEMRQSIMSGRISISEFSFSSEFILLALRASSINLFHSSFLRVLSTVHIYGRSGRYLLLISGKWFIMSGTSFTKFHTAFVESS